MSKKWGHAMNINEKKYPKILVISNNPFSKTSNNGKTLASFFREFPPENIAQIYFSSEIPTEERYFNYYRITDIQVLKSLLTFASPGSEIKINKKKSETEKKLIKNTYKFIPKSDFFRLLRDFMWKSKKWQSSELINWIKTFSPDIIFFCAGDTGFVYDVVSFVLNITKAKLITYITDDYILPRNTISIFWWIRRNIIFKKMYNAVSRSNLFITISEQMRKTYKELFKKDSIVALNMTETMRMENFDSKKLDKNYINLIYAGGLHYKRYETLSLLAEAINYYNYQSRNNKAFLSIYSTTVPNKKILNKLNIQGASRFLGELNYEELKLKLNEADILVHVESFNLKSIESTRLSISTKIPEYLSLAKPILAIGPEEVASMKYLKDVAYCITRINDIKNEVSNFLNDAKLRNYLSVLSLDKYSTNHNIKVLRKEFEDKIFEIMSE